MTLKGKGRQGCLAPGCDRPHSSKGYCAIDAERMRRYGAPVLVGRGRIPVDPLKRFMSKIKINDETDCWEWQAHIGINGYGTFRIDQGRRGPAHRRGWEILRGPLPDYLVLDHLCRVTKCVNPDHLEPVTPQVNLAREWEARRALKAAS